MMYFMFTNMNMEPKDIFRAAVFALIIIGSVYLLNK